MGPLEMELEITVAIEAQLNTGFKVLFRTFGTEGLPGLPSCGCALTAAYNQEHFTKHDPDEPVFAKDIKTWAENRYGFNETDMFIQGFDGNMFRDSWLPMEGFYKAGARVRAKAVEMRQRNEGV